jgi:hypothetical protein
MTDEAPYWSYSSKPGERRLTERELIDKAVQFLLAEISSDDISGIGAAMAKDSDFRVNQHFGMGMNVRNVLRKMDVKLDDIWLDGKWFEVLQKAVEKCKCASDTTIETPKGNGKANSK